MEAEAAPVSSGRKGRQTARDATARHSGSRSRSGGKSQDAEEPDADEEEEEEDAGSDDGARPDDDDYEDADEAEEEEEEQEDDAEEEEEEEVKVRAAPSRARSRRRAPTRRSSRARKRRKVRAVQDDEDEEEEAEEQLQQGEREVKLEEQNGDDTDEDKKRGDAEADEQAEVTEGAELEEEEEDAEEEEEEEEDEEEEEEEQEEEEQDGEEEEEEQEPSELEPVHPVTDSREITLSMRALNRHLTCGLCSGYYREATTIIDCAHTCQTQTSRQRSTAVPAAVSCLQPSAVLQSVCAASLSTSSRPQHTRTRHARRQLRRHAAQLRPLLSCQLSRPLMPSHFVPFIFSPLRQSCRSRLVTADPIRNETKSALLSRCSPAAACSSALRLTAAVHAAVCCCRFDRALQNLVDKLLPQFHQQDEVRQQRQSCSCCASLSSAATDAAGLLCVAGAAKMLKRELLNSAGLVRSSSDLPGRKQRKDQSAAPHAAHQLRSASNPCPALTAPAVVLCCGSSLVQSLAAADLRGAASGGLLSASAASPLRRHHPEGYGAQHPAADRAAHQRAVVQ